MIRNVIGSLLALAGAAAAVWSPFRDWYDGRPGEDYRVQDLFEGISRANAALFGSVMLPMAFAAVVALVGVVLRSRLLVALAGVVVLGFSVLWAVRQGQAAGSLTVGGDGSGLGPGAGLAFGGGVLLLLAAVVMSGRRGRRRPYAREPQRQAPGDDWGPQGSDPNGPVHHQDAPYQQQPPYYGEEAGRGDPYRQQPPYHGEEAGQSAPYRQQPPYYGEEAGRGDPYRQQPPYDGGEPEQNGPPTRRMRFRRH